MPWLCNTGRDSAFYLHLSGGGTQGITTLNMEYNIPFIFGVLTTEHAFNRPSTESGGKYGNKGDEAAITAIKMAALQIDLEG
jgi:6,7-dimethyl-8-ribityllumazine synthase